MKNSSNHPTTVENASQYRSIFDAAIDGLIISDLETSHVLDANPAACRMHGYPREEFIGLRLHALIHSDDQRQFDQQLRAIQMLGGMDTRTTQLSRNGETFSAEWRGTPFTFQGLPCLLSIVRDVSKRIRTEQNLHLREQTHTHEQATLLGISHTLASTQEFQPGLILDQLREMVPYDRGALFALEDTTIVSLALRGTPQLEASPPFRITLGVSEGLPAFFDEHQPLRIADIRSDSQPSNLLLSMLSDKSTGFLKNMHSCLWVSLAVKGRLIGGFALAHAQINYFTAHHADLALSVANQAAITMANAELYGKAQALAVVEERQRLARNLHDAVNQSLFSAGLIAEVLPRLWERDQSEARRSLEDLRRLTHGAMAEMRALLAELRPSTITDADLGDLLHQLAEAFIGRTNVPTRVTVLGKKVLPAEVQVAIYRVCQEALSNIAKHAAARQVEITLKHEIAFTEMIILDDGRGFDSELTISGHYGLSMMRERANAVSAELSLTSKPGHGTQLTFRWAPAGEA